MNSKMFLTTILLRKRIPGKQWIGKYRRPRQVTISMKQAMIRRLEIEAENEYWLSQPYLTQEQEYKHNAEERRAKCKIPIPPKDELAVFSVEDQLASNNEDSTYSKEEAKKLESKTYSSTGQQQVQQQLAEFWEVKISRNRMQLSLLPAHCQGIQKATFYRTVLQEMRLHRPLCHCHTMCLSSSTA
ncbi:hypothetical protein IHE44_0005492 [Lamprotornis superbus]|uniref:Ribosomal protein 63, mitochondrial n=1 Tax=Lamprotornis superbus TaxID=245042 RepID=A0A835TTK7_9PASS|nr:hypothetical protein IHE44_0005492 [Lamprotornis superbus]